ncbi:MAG TPA: hypothetical protein VEX86_09130 [Longimicrobium sp.]|nr:hypothetical protein [Longimicrobium sp.]
MNIRAWKVLLSAGVIAAAAAPAAGAIARERPPPPAAHHSARENPATHNMMLVGENTAYLSHLPMFEALDDAGTAYHTPHRFQVILEVTFSKNGRDVTRRYLDDRKRHPAEKMYTLNPADFVLPDLFPAGSRAGLDRFAANKVFRGHLERGGQPIPALDGVQVNVRRVIRSATFDPAVQQPQRLSYILFGKTGELFLAHAISRPPDFDQILSVHVDGHTFTDDELARGVEITFPSLANTSTQRIRQDATGEGEARVAGAQQATNVRIHAARELYFEEGELHMPATFDNTAEETQAEF